MKNSLVQKLFKMSKEREGGVKSKMSVLTVILFVVLALYVLSLVLLLLFAVITANTSPVNYQAGLGLPKAWHFNIADLFDTDVLSIVTFKNGELKVYGFFSMFGLSLWYSLSSGLMKAIVPCLTAYACARYKFKFSKVMYVIVIIVMAVPIVGNQPSEFRIVNALGLYDNIWFIWILKSNFLGIYFLVFYEFFDSIPKAVTEAAKIDGAGNFRIMWKICLPLARNVFFTVFLIETINFWNDYQTPLMYLKNYPTLARLMYVAIVESSQPGLNMIPQKAAAVLVIILPTLCVFLVFQNRLMGNLTVGGVKG